MMKASLSSGKREMVRYEEDEEERRITVGSFMEIMHYIVPAYRFFRFARAMENEQNSDKVIKKEVSEGLDRDEKSYGDSSSSEDKPLRLKLGFLNLKLN